MTIKLTLPEVGENIESGQIVKVLVKPGDKIERDQSVVELETGKATVEVPATEAGQVVAVLVKEGDTVNVGGALVELEPAAGAVPAAEPPPPATPTPPPPPEARREAARPAEAVAPPPAPAETRPAAPPPPAAAPAPAVPAPTGQAIAAPHVRAFAREIGVDLQQVAGSGPGGRISEEDVKRHAREQGTGGAAGRLGAAPVLKLPDFAKYGPVERVPMTSVRRVIAQQMSVGWAAIPHVLLQAKADATELEKFRDSYKAKAEQAGGKLTITAILLKVVAAGLRAFPNVNASLDVQRNEVVVKKYCHVGVATDTPRGLLVPVVRDVDKKNLVQISADLTRLAGRAREGKLAPAEMEGACISVTNLGGLGIGHFSAIINHPEIAILGVGRATMEPVWDGHAFQPRLMLPLTLSIDHRILDGADGARFLKWVVDAIEQPFLLALES